VDKALIQRKLAELDARRMELSEFQGLSLEAYRADWKTQRIIERTLHIMIEICVDIANMIIAAEAMRPPGGYADTFRVLTANGLLGVELGERMQKMARFRNIIVHQYEDLNAAIVVEIVRNRTGDFSEYAQAVLRYLDKATKP
jgi:uncharacterized protein YutE (UPF0331/DUF86 family)